MACWGCDVLVHLRCLELGDRVYAGPWYCAGCRLALADYKDLTLDAPLLAYVIAGEEPDEKNVARVHKAAGFVKWDEGRLWLRRGDAQVEVPPMRERARIVEQTALAMALPSGARLYELLRTRYWWRGLR